jgi:hypothetical protein
MSETANGSEFIPKDNSAEQPPIKEISWIQSDYEALIRAGCSPEEAIRLIDRQLRDDGIEQ